MRINFSLPLSPQFTGHTETTLDLAASSLFSKPLSLIQHLFSAMPANFTVLELGENNFSSEVNYTFESLCASIPATVIDINFGWNNLNALTNEKLVNALRKLSSSITGLDLRGNCLNELSLVELSKVFASLPPNLTTLDIRNNYIDMLFQNLTDDQLAQVFYGIPVSLKRIICEKPLQDRVTNIINQLPAMIKAGRFFAFDNIKHVGLLPDLADISINYIANVASGFWTHKPQPDEKSPPIQLDLNKFPLR